MGLLTDHRSIALIAEQDSGYAGTRSISRSHASSPVSFSFERKPMRYIASF
jgi:hypothetical protein